MKQTTYAKFLDHTLILLPTSYGPNMLSRVKMEHPKRQKLKRSMK